VSRYDEDEHHRPDPKKTTGSGVDESPLIEFEEEGTERVLIAEEEVEEEMHHQPLEYNKWLMATQCIFGSLFCVVVLFGESIVTHKFYVY
jgi:sodium/potassium/calcium exchanger 6